MNGSIQKGMPHKFYHGKTGKVFNVTKSALGVIVNKQVRSVHAHLLLHHVHVLCLFRNRIIPKKINVRIEHVQQSRCREDFLKRVKANHEKKLQAKANGEKVHRSCTGGSC